MPLLNRFTFAPLMKAAKKMTGQKTDKAVTLGRWGLYPDKNTDLVVDYSNEDHCGTCAQYAQTKQKPDDVIKKNDDIQKS